MKALLLGVEVVSPSTGDDDRTTKRDYYRRAAVPEYWIVDLDERSLERWRPGDDRPEVVRGTLTWRPEGTRTPLTLDLRAFFGRVLRE